MQITRIVYYKEEGEYHIHLQDSSDGKYRAMRSNYLTEEETDWINKCSSREETPDKIKWTNW